jgi:hypothetical protein
MGSLECRVGQLKSHEFIKAFFVALFLSFITILIKFLYFFGFEKEFTLIKLN